MPELTISRRNLIAGSAAAAGVALLFNLQGRAGAATAPPGPFKVSYTPAQWRARLSPAAYYVLREEGTERAGTSPLNNEHRAGTFVCAGCALPLFSSTTKFDSGTGWPSFWAPIDEKALGTRTQGSGRFLQTEVHCRRCGGHLGHIFPDGPEPTGLRYCINGVALKFKAA